MEDEKLLELAAACEKATGPDREIDRAIQLAIRKPVPSDKWTGRDAIPPQKPRHFTASIDAAMTLVPEGHYWEVAFGMRQRGKGPYWAEVYRMDGSDYDYEPPIFGAATPALALCAAALRAQARKDGDTTGA